MEASTYITDKRELRKMRKKLRGKYDDIVASTGKAKSTVTAVLKGEFRNEEIMAKALELYNKSLEA